MTSEQVKAWVDNATDAEVALWLALIRLAEAFSRVGEAQRDATIEAVWQLAQREQDMDVWRQAIAGWD